MATSWWQALSVACLMFLQLQGCGEYNSLEEAKEEVCFNVTCRSYCLLCMNDKWDFYTSKQREKSYDTMKSCGYDQATCEGER